MTNDLVFEIGTEEIPASFIPRALSSLEALLKKRLEDRRLEFRGLRAFGTPRRLAFIVEGLEDKEKDARVEVRGPNARAAYDSSGNPTKTLEGFAKAQGVRLKDIRTVKTEKGEYVLAVKEIKGEKTAKILPQILKDVLQAEVFPKSMRWGSHEVSFARPVHWILAVYGGAAIPVSFGHVKGSSSTFGHRFLGGGKGGAKKPLKVTGVKSYIEGLRKNFVIADPLQRKEMILEGLNKKASEAGGVVLRDDGLLEEVSYLTEYPVVLRGSFGKEFLDIPRDVVINAMREHQRYFSVTDKMGGLLPHFLTIANTKARRGDVVIKGNERVLRARLNDAKFYFEKDVRVPLAQRARSLKGVVFQSKLGTSYEKVMRFTELALFIGDKTGFSRPLEASETPEDFLSESFDPAQYRTFSLDAGLKSKYVLGRAAVLSKADLVSGVVGEFPKLQGIMGSVYARRGGEAPEVAAAIYEHYLPIVSGGPLPASVPGAIISMADKLDTIAGCFSVGLIPTGEKDPYALRRQALGIIAIMTDKGFRVPLDILIDKEMALLRDKPARKGADVKNDVLEFFKERLKNQLLSQNIAFDAIDSVLSTNWYDIPDAVKRAQAIEGFKGHPDCARLAVAFKRVSNILKGQELGTQGPDPALFKDSLESGLYRAREEVFPAISASIKRGDYKAALEGLASIKETIDAFFDKVMVMVDDKAVRANRLLLLNSVRGLYYSIADLSKLSV